MHKILIAIALVFGLSACAGFYDLLPDLGAGSVEPMECGALSCPDMAAPDAGDQQ